MSSFPVWTWILSLLVLVGVGEASKIFFMIPLTSISEKNLYIPLIDELGKRGHEVTVATIKKSSYKSKNIKEFSPISYSEFMGEEYSNAKESREQGKLMMYTFDPQFNYDACHKVFQNTEFQRAIGLDQKYDLIFTNYFFQHCFAGVLHLHQVPFIILCTMPPVPYLLELTGYKLPMSTIPNPLLISTDRMTFLQRVENVIFDFYWTNFEKLSYIPNSEKIYRQYLGQHLPGGFEIESNVSLVYVNSHAILNGPTPIMPDVVEIAGIHCRPGNPLPKDIEEFVSGAKDGFIYFSMGSIVHSSSMPKEWFDIFVAVFSKLKQRVLWKWEDDQDVSKFPKNVMVKKWMPQQDILAHPNIKLFITHGGAMSTQESLCHGVPMIGFPIFGDQDLNMLNADRKGFAKMLEILNLSEEYLENAINDMLNDPKYGKRTKEMSAIFQDQRETPLERAVYFAEYAIRHNGTRHLRSVGRDLSFFQYYLWDVFAFLAVIILSVFLTIFLILRFVCRAICGRKREPSRGSESIKKRN